MSLTVRAPFSVIDGGLSTALEELGEHPTGALWTAEALIDRPELIVAAHRRFVDAGADIVITSSYQASVPGFVAAGVDAARARQLLAASTDLARRAGAPVVAASVGPFGALLADGSEYHGRYAADWDEVRMVHRARIEVLADTDADIIAVETMPSVREAVVVVEEVRRLTDRPMWLSFICSDGDHTVSGDALGDAGATVLAAVGGAVDALGVNCTAPRHVEAALRNLAGPAGGRPLLAYPNHGADWDAEHRCWVGGAGGLELTEHLEVWIAAGARLVGGCCGVGSEGIRAVVSHRDAMV